MAAPISNYIPQSPTKGLLRVHNVAILLGCSKRAVRKWSQNGLLAGFKTGPRLWAFRLIDVLRFAHDHDIRVQESFWTKKSPAGALTPARVTPEGYPFRNEVPYH